jgi:hypothetical protein
VIIGLQDSVLTKGSIPEHEQSTDSIYNTATAYSPDGTYLSLFLPLLDMLSVRENGCKTQEGSFIRYRYSWQTDIQSKPPIFFHSLTSQSEPLSGHSLKIHEWIRCMTYGEE